jgi:hypothetical protein
MQLCANAKERTREDWVALFAAADSRFKLERVISPPHSALSVIEVVWTGEKEPNGVTANGKSAPNGNLNGTYGINGTNGVHSPNTLFEAGNQRSDEVQVTNGDQ